MWKCCSDSAEGTSCSARVFVQVKCFPPALLTDWLIRRPWLGVRRWAAGWRPWVSSIWPGALGWTTASRPGCLTVAWGFPSARCARTVPLENQASEPFHRQNWTTGRRASMLSAIEVCISIRGVNWMVRHGTIRNQILYPAMRYLPSNMIRSRSI